MKYPLPHLLALFCALFATGAAGAVKPANYTFQECNTLDERALRDELNAIAQRTLRADSLDLPALVDAQWRRLDMNSVLAAEVAAASAAVREREAYLSRLWSSWSADKATELAEEVAGRAFASDGFTAAITELSAAIAVDVAGALQTASARSASSALGCLQTFIGGRYSTSLVDVFDAELQAQLDDAELGGTLEQDFSVPGMHSTALAGVGVIIGAQIARQLARRLAARITGRIVTRVAGRAAATLVPVVGWIAGAGMIAWDLWAGADGALPQIEQALTAPEVETEIKQEIVAAVGPELERELPQVARQVADNLYSAWRDFKRDYADVLALARRNPAFKTILDDTDTDSVYRLARLVAVGNEVLGGARFGEIIDDGRLRRLLALPDGVDEVLVETRSVDATLVWGELAGDRLGDIARLQIHRQRGADRLDAATLGGIIALDSADVVQTLLRRPDDEVRALLKIPPERLKPLLRRYDDGSLGWLAGYAETLPSGARKRLVARLQKQPAALDRLKSRALQRSLADGADVDETLDFLLADGGVTRLVGDVGGLAGGSVSLALFWQKYGSARNVAIVLGVLALWIGIGMLRRRRNRRPIVVNVTTAPGTPPTVSYDDR